MAGTYTGKLAWGILGTGAIARDFAAAIDVSRTGRLVAVASRAPEAAARFGETFDVPRRYAPYEALLADPEVDAVYIALPNDLHAEWAVRCAEAGKHILCEKPLAMTQAEASSVIEHVRRNDVFLLEGFMYRCHPRTARLVALLESGAIGRPRLIHCTFSFDLGPRGGDIRLSRDRGGGGIMDVGCYTTSMALLLAGDRPLEVTGVAHVGAESGVDEWATAGLRFPGGLLATLTCGIRLELGSGLTIWGENGRIEVPDPFFPGKGRTSILLRRNGEPEPEEIVTIGENEPFALEIDSVARYLADRQVPSPGMDWEASLANMAVLDAWHRAIAMPGGLVSSPR